MDLDKLRKKAEALLNENQNTIPITDVSQLLQELEIHQIELELQNEELQAAQAELESLRQRYYDLYMFAPVGYLVVDQNGQIEDANLTACQLLDKERHYVLGRPLSKFFTSQSRTAFFELLNIVFELEMPQRAEFVLIAKNDAENHKHVAATIQTFHDGFKHLARLALTDISDHVRSEKEKLDQYRVMFDTSHSVKLLLDPDTGEIVDANQTACQFYRYDKNTLLGMQITDINHMPAKALKQEMQLARSGKRQHFNFRHRLADGEIRDVEVFSGPIEMGGRTLLYSIIHDVTDLKESEAERRLLWHAVDQSANSVVITDARGNIEYVNPCFTKLTGYSLSDVAGENPRILSAGQTSDDKYKDLWATITSGQEWTGEFHNKKKNGELFWERATISPVTDLDGTITHFVAIKEDITEWKATLEALQHNEFMLRRSQSIARLGAWSWDLLSDTIEWDDEMYLSMGIEADSFDGSVIDVIQQIIHPDDRKRVQVEIPEALETESSEGVEYRILLSDGSVRHIWWLPGERERDNDGNLISVSGIVQDITERKEAEIQVREAERLYRKIAGLLSDYAYSFTVLEDGTLVRDWVTDSFQTVTGYTPDQLDKKGGWAKLIFPADLPVAHKRAQNLMTGQPDISEFRFVRADGEVRWLQDSGYAIYDTDQERVVQIYGAARDITEHKMREEHLRLEAETQATILGLLNSDTPDQDSFIELALEEAVKLTNSTVGYFHFVNRDQVTLNFFKWSKGVMEYCTAAADSHYPLADAGVWADCVRIGKPVVHNDYVNLDDKKGLPEGHFPLVRHMSVPVMDGDKPVAVIGVGNSLQPYSDADVARLTLMSSTLWSWIERKRALTEIQQQNSEIRAINQVISISTSTLDTEEIIKLACHELSSVLEAGSVAFALLDKTRGDYHVITPASMQSSDTTAVAPPLIKVDDAILDALERYGIPQVAKGPSGSHLNSVFVPVKQRNVMIGFFCIDFEAEHPLTDRDLILTSRIAQALSPALENSLLHQRISRHNEQLTSLVDERTAELKRINQRLRIILNNVSNPILLIDTQKNIDIANPAFNQKLGYEIDELYGQPILELFGPEKRADISTLLNTIEDQKQTKPIEAKVIAKDGTFLDVEVALAFVEGNTGHIVCTLYDISHIKELDRIKDQFVSMVSHELRTPIASMLLSSSTMERYYGKLSEQQKLRKITQIKEQALLLTELVTSILDISRANTRKGQRVHNLVDVGDILHQVVAELTEQAALKQQVIDVEMTNDDLTLMGEKTDVTRIWHNLLSNAVKYTQEGGHISVRLLNTGTSDENVLANLSDFAKVLPEDLDTTAYIIGMVRDNGHGIHPEDMQQLFTRFFRGWAAGTNITGTGLGLSLVRDLLQLYGGDIAVQSELNVGTTFCFWLPVEDESQKDK